MNNSWLSLVVLKFSKFCSKVKVEKKLNKNKYSGEKRQQLEEMRAVLESELRQEGVRVLDTERKTVREAAAQERAIMTVLASGLGPAIGQEVALIREVEQMEEIWEKMNAVLFDKQRFDEVMQRQYFLETKTC